VTFTPADSTDYSSTTGTVSVMIGKATPTVSAWPTASSITNGQTLASSTLTGGVASVTGTFAWTNPSTAPTAGTAGYSVTFTPADSTDYSNVTGTVSVTAGDFTVSFGNTSYSMDIYNDGHYSFTVTPASGRFGSDVTYSASAITINASELPVGGKSPVSSEASFSPRTIAAGSGATTVDLIIPADVTLYVFHGNQTVQTMKHAPLVLALLLVPLWALRRGMRRWATLLIVVVGLAASIGVTGCDNKKNVHGTFTVTVTSGGISHSTDLSVEFDGG
jgi:hypothetical protein